ncbi:membrane-associated phospholipid phosphatase [Larkinella arboricola]|uniref:Membrane-associated phospholipid phosphatase n=1 Tax=Larkinella arboricola TaxID=643671 RepID=A0A327X135_LARAB|nr:phosphatase PAP2 family protein [Larkinella arboricola]RAJ97994.1 membrane-associated phospholipid phosphatase [Larkinella arboricola]
MNILARNRSFFFVYLSAFILVSIGMLTYSKTELMQWVNAHHTPSADVFFRNVTYLGDGAFAVIVTVALAFCSFRFALMGAASFLLSTAIVRVLKQLVFAGSLRPLKYFEHSDWQYRVIEGLDIHSYNSFPSGHSTTAFAIFCLLALLDERKSRGWFWALMAIITAYSRVYLFQHFVEDVYVGSIIGTVSSVVVFLLLSRYWDQHPKTWHSRRIRFRRS